MLRLVAPRFVMDLQLFKVHAPRSYLKLLALLSSQFCRAEGSPRAHLSWGRNIGKELADICSLRAKHIFNSTYWGILWLSSAVKGLKWGSGWSMIQGSAIGIWKQTPNKTSWVARLKLVAGVLLLLVQVSHQSAIWPKHQQKSSCLGIPSPLDNYY